MCFAFFAKTLLFLLKINNIGCLSGSYFISEVVSNATKLTPNLPHRHCSLEFSTVLVIFALDSSPSRLEVRHAAELRDRFLFSLVYRLEMFDFFESGDVQNTFLLKCPRFSPVEPSAL